MRIELDATQAAFLLNLLKGDTNFEAEVIQRKLNAAAWKPSKGDTLSPSMVATLAYYAGRRTSTGRGYAATKDALRKRGLIQECNIFPYVEATRAGLAELDARGIFALHGKTVAEFNERVPVGAEVMYWPGAIESGTPRMAILTEPAREWKGQVCAFLTPGGLVSVSHIVYPRPESA